MCSSAVSLRENTDTGGQPRGETRPGLCVSTFREQDTGEELGKSRERGRPLRHVSMEIRRHFIKTDSTGTGYGSRTGKMRERG
ncbi:uncharacterized protein LOC144867359 isoform X3 [Branchiostoma floridae x Branchiostoma japonicum]